MRQKRNVMDKVPCPSSKRRFLFSEDLPIPLCPNIPSSSEDNLSEERMTEIPPNCLSHLICGLVRLNGPRNPKIVPNPLAKIASKEKMSPILMLCKVA